MNDAFLFTQETLPNPNVLQEETVFSLSNGHLGVRASYVVAGPGEKNTKPGAFVNGFYDSHPIEYGEWAYGYAKDHQTIVKLPDLRKLTLRAGESPVSEASRSEEILDMAQGVLQETYQVRFEDGKELELSVHSFVSLEQAEVYASRLSLKALNFSGPVTIQKELAFESESGAQELDPRVAGNRTQLTVAKTPDYDCLQTQNSHQSLLLAQLFQSEGHSVTATTGEVTCDVATDKETTVDLFVYLSNWFATDDASAKAKVTADFQKTIGRYDYEELLGLQQKAYEQFWMQSDIQITGDAKLQKGLRFNLFQLFQNAGRDGVTNYPAKGLTGPGYEGHYFWDTEMYLLPFFIYTQPEIAKKLLTYRLQILPAAKKRAAEMHQKGALYAWRTINGNEASAYYPAGTAQVHINADIVFAFQLYEKVTGDHEFIQEAREVIYETARFWAGFGHWVERDGRKQFGINGVTGPDEYSALVNNNYYTNKMAQNNLQYAAEIGANDASISAEERDAWQAAAEGMILPYDADKQILKQDDAFLEKETWDFANTKAEEYPLLLHFHPMVIYRHQVTKQADSLLAELHFPQDYSTDQITRDYDYYEKVTTHDSSLSRSIFSVLASRIGKVEKGYEYFMDTALMDITDLQGNVKDGIHAANMGGSWISLIYGFAGLETGAKCISLHNHLPKEISEMRFHLQLLGELVKVELASGKTRVQSLAEQSRLAITETADGSVEIQL